jgi:ribonuclease R
MRYAIGTRVRVQVSWVDLDGRRIDFRLVHEGEGLVSRPAKGKESMGEGSERADEGRDTGSPSAKRARRKISEPLARAPRSDAQSVKPGDRPEAAKNKEKGRKPRRRS